MEYCRFGCVLFSLFLARDSEERERWIRSLEDTIKRHSQARKVCLMMLLGVVLHFSGHYPAILTDYVRCIELNLEFLFFIPMCRDQWLDFRLCLIHPKKIWKHV